MGQGAREERAGRAAEPASRGLLRRHLWWVLPLAAVAILLTVLLSLLGGEGEAPFHYDVR